MTAFLMILIVLWLPISAIAASTFVLHKYWKYYPVIYNTLNNKVFKYAEEQWFSLDNDIILFTDNGDIKLAEEVYLFNNYVTYFDLYSWYWHWKYTKWFKNNVLNK